MIIVGVMTNSSSQQRRTVLAALVVSLLASLAPPVTGVRIEVEQGAATSMSSGCGLVPPGYTADLHKCTLSLQQFLGNPTVNIVDEMHRGKMCAGESAPSTPCFCGTNIDKTDGKLMFEFFFVCVPNYKYHLARNLKLEMVEMKVKVNSKVQYQRLPFTPLDCRDTICRSCTPGTVKCADCHEGFSLDGPICTISCNRTIPGCTSCSKSNLNGPVQCDDCAQDLLLAANKSACTSRTPVTSDAGQKNVRWWKWVCLVAICMLVVCLSQF